MYDYCSLLIIQGHLHCGNIDECSQIYNTTGSVSNVSRNNVKSRDLQVSLLPFQLSHLSKFSKVLHCDPNNRTVEERMQTALRCCSRLVSLKK